MDEVWYRYEDVRYAPPVDEWGDPQPGPGVLEVKLRTYPVLRHTPKGAWLSGVGWRDKFVLRESRKRFACPTIAEAKESFIARKMRQARIHHARAKQAEDSIKIISPWRSAIHKAGDEKEEP